MADALPHEATAAPAASRGLEVRTPPGRIRGVYTTRSIAEGEVVEVAPTVLMNEAECLHMDETPLGDYYFAWGEVGRGAVILGYGMLYNHSYRPNLVYRRDYSAGTMIYIALRDIAPGEQLTINYNGLPDGGAPLWFEPDPDI